jgi:hypothetical protein
VAQRIRASLGARRTLGVTLGAELDGNGLARVRLGSTTVAVDADASAIGGLFVLTTRHTPVRSDDETLGADAAIVGDADLVRTAAIAVVVEARRRDDPEKYAQPNQARKTLQTNVRIRKTLRFLKDLRPIQHLKPRPAYWPVHQKRAQAAAVA